MKKELIQKGIWFFFVAVLVGTFVGWTSGVFLWGFFVGLLLGTVFFLIALAGRSN